MADFEDIDDKPVYMISVAAKLAGMHPQTLRIYERKRLLTPGRTAKSTRLYSQRDIDRLKYIQQLTQEKGVNLAGARIIIELQSRLEDVRKILIQMEQQVVETEERLAAETAKVTRHYRREIALIPRGQLVKLKVKEGRGKREEGRSAEIK